ncbi:MAG: carboxypeptidase-like regulatory domain-containing protein [Coriobacteriales bacterium]|jgi:hypothetical protein|nr:carboxypeptidase-like regulatory domain-containing protein [Coriobacteriales bacterium]
MKKLLPFALVFSLMFVLALPAFAASSEVAMKNLSMSICYDDEVYVGESSTVTIVVTSLSGNNKGSLTVGGDTTYFELKNKASETFTFVFTYEEAGIYCETIVLAEVNGSGKTLETTCEEITIVVNKPEVTEPMAQLTGSVFNAHDTWPIADAEVLVCGGDPHEEYSFWTEGTGEFLFSLPAGSYHVSVWGHDQDYLVFAQDIVISADDPYILSVPLIPVDGIETGSGTLVGWVADYATGSLLSDVELVFYNSWFDGQGYSSWTCFTDEFGVYSQNLPCGYYTVTALMEGYVAGTMYVVVNDATTYRNFNLIPE